MKIEFKCPGDYSTCFENQKRDGWIPVSCKNCSIKEQKVIIKMKKIILKNRKKKSNVFEMKTTIGTYTVEINKEIYEINRDNEQKEFQEFTITRGDDCQNNKELFDAGKFDKQERFVNFISNAPFVLFEASDINIIKQKNGNYWLIIEFDDPFYGSQEYLLTV